MLHATAPAETSGEEQVEVNCDGCYRQENIKIHKLRVALLSNSSILPQASANQRLGKGPGKTESLQPKTAEVVERQYKGVFVSAI